MTDRTRCPLCGARRARRACPALDRVICAVCCGTKRLVEIRCPESCVYLRTAEAHPPALVRRRQERDTAFLAAGLAGASDRERARALLVMAALRAAGRPARDERTVLGSRPADRDLAEAVAALAESLEVSARGVIYEAQPAGATARRILATVRERIGPVLERADRLVERELASAARRVERMAREASTTFGGEAAFVEWLERALADEPAGSPASRLIVPPA